MIRSKQSILVIVVAVLLASGAAAQSTIKLVGRKSSEVELAYGKRSVIFNLDEVLIGNNGSLPGNAPHRYKVLFTAEKGGMIYIVANVRSASPVSNPMAPCGGDRPQSLLWIEADKSLKNRRVQSEIYASCSYNYFDSKVKQDKSGITVLIGGQRKIELRYDNANPEKGLTMKTVD